MGSSLTGRAAPSPPDWVRTYQQDQAALQNARAVYDQRLMNTTAAQRAAAYGDGLRNVYAAPSPVEAVKAKVAETKVEAKTADQSFADEIDNIRQLYGRPGTEDPT